MLGDIPGLGLTLEQASRELLSRYRTQTCDGLWHTLQDEGYILDHLVWQFQKAGWPEEIEKLFWEETDDGRCGWLDARERQLRESGFLSDILYAQRLAEDELTRANQRRSTHSSFKTASSLCLDPCLVHQPSRPYSRLASWCRAGT